MHSSQPDRRYYYKVFQRARQFRVGLDAKGWRNLWHTHFDWNGFGDLGWTHRRRHLAALLCALARARRELVGAGQACQLFALIHTPKGSANDAIYVHTQNPFGTPFPTPLNGTPLTTLPPLLAGRIDPDHYNVLRTAHGSYIVQAKQLEHPTFQTPSP